MMSKTRVQSFLRVNFWIYDVDLENRSHLWHKTNLHDLSQKLVESL